MKGKVVTAWHTFRNYDIYLIFQITLGNSQIISHLFGNDGDLLIKCINGASTFDSR